MTFGQYVNLCELSMMNPEMDVYLDVLKKIKLVQDAFNQDGGVV